MRKVSSLMSLFELHMLMKDATFRTCIKPRFPRATLNLIRCLTRVLPPEPVVFWVGCSDRATSYWCSCSSQIAGSSSRRYTTKLGRHLKHGKHLSGQREQAKTHRVVYGFIYPILFCLICSTLPKARSLTSKYRDERAANQTKTPRLVNAFNLPYFGG